MKILIKIIPLVLFLATGLTAYFLLSPKVTDMTETMRKEVEAEIGSEIHENAEIQYREDVTIPEYNADNKYRKDVTTPGHDNEGTVETDENNVTVTLKVPAHAAVISQNPITVKVGEEARFSILLDENYTVDKSDIPYANGTFTVTDCRADAEYSFSVKPLATYADYAFVLSDDTLGTVKSAKAPGKYAVGTEITLSATPKSGKTFLGWSDGGTVINGGTMVSYTAEYTFVLEGNVTLYPNFLTEGYTSICYDLNGGVLAADGVTEAVLTQFDGKIRLCPNLEIDNGTFVRDGYTLLEYTENRDGTGQAVDPGGIAVIDDDALLVTFYAQWSKWTSASDFLYTTDGLTVTITDYKGNAEELSIPEKIGGIPVTRIAANAVVNKDFTKLVIPRTVVKIDALAFKNCKSFDSLYIRDSFTDIPEAAFTNCKKFSHLQLGACVYPYFSSNAESITTRMENIIKRESPDKPIIMMVGGSSSLYGYYSPILEEGLNHKYQILNAGTNAGGTGVLYMEGLAHYMLPGDIIVNGPEYGANQMGGRQIVWRTFRATESCYNIFRYVDFSQYTDFFTGMSEFNALSEARGGRSGTTYAKKNTSLTTRYCDLTGTANGSNTFDPSRIYDGFSVTAGQLSNDKVNQINRLIDILGEKGITYYLSCAPILCEKQNSNGTKTRLTTDANLQAYYERACSVLHCQVISHPINYQFYVEDYFNSSYHLTAEKARERTRRLLNDLLAEFAAEGVVIFD